MTELENSIAKPFQQGDLVKLALYTGLIVTMVWAGMQILKPVKEVVEEVVENVGDAVS